MLCERCSCEVEGRERVEAEVCAEKVEKSVDAGVQVCVEVDEKFTQVDERELFSVKEIIYMYREALVGSKFDRRTVPEPEEAMWTMEARKLVVRLLFISHNIIMLCSYRMMGYKVEEKKQR